MRTDVPANSRAQTEVVDSRMPSPVARAMVFVQRPIVLLTVLAIVAAATIVLFLTVGIVGSPSFAIPFRARKVVAMVIVAFAIGISTVLFQTITDNRILTPSIMGFDSLYVLIQTVVVFFFGSTALAVADPRVSWVVEVALMVAFSTLLFQWLFAGARRSIHLLVLVGIVFGMLFRSVSSLFQRMLDPASFAVLQDSFFASFNAVDEDLVLISGIVVVIVSTIALRLVRVFDVIGLGESHATGLGVDHRRVVTLMLVLIAVLVAVSTALVGPVTFFGLIVSNLAYALVRTHRHASILPATVLLGVICLVGGQLVLERAFGLDTALSVIVEFVGGILFIVLLVRRGVR
ncbi:iron chelate uptake ABC transporter family permease subunit [Marisediminicola sp. LYQ85]|uniref:iron chelate uptake ABC transporter family permease subunit n=1 Tax=Marisediminicola sp. LYQ85 TaxID=3391062 RepID=UPI003983CAC2